MIFDSEQEIRLGGYSKLRWIASIGSLIAYLFSLLILKLELNHLPAIIIGGLTIASNLLFDLFYKKAAFRFEHLVGLALIVDITLLTSLLFFYGGYTNPFSTLYLVHIILAAFLLGKNWTWLVFSITSLCFVGLSVWYYPIAELSMDAHHGHHQSGFSLHLYGMLFGYIMIGALLSFFLTKMGQELRRNQQILNELEKEKESERKLLALAGLTAGAAHELSTPISTIQLISDNLKAQLDGNSKLAEDLREIETELGRCTSILNKMRNYGPELPGEIPKKISPEELKSSLLIRLAQDSDRVEFLNFEGTWKFSCLSEALQVALISLIKNALQAVSESQRVQVVLHRDDKAISFSVIDQGSGIEPSHLRRVGDPFFTTKDPGQGMGLGVFLVKLFVQQVRGEFKISSQPGLGTKVLFSFPTTMAKA